MKPDWYKKVSTTPKEHTKKVELAGGRAYTSINASYQRDLATSLWGPYGHKWGLKNLNFGTIDNGAPIMHTLKAKFFYPVGDDIVSFPIATDLRVYTSKGQIVDDPYKKMITDVTTKALSFLGFSLDIFLGMYDDDKYVANIPKTERLIKLDASKKVIDSFISALGKAKTDDRISELLENLNNYTLTPEQQASIDEAVKKRRESL